MKLRANERNIDAEQRAFLELEFTLEGEDLTGKTMFFVLQQNSYTPGPLLIKDHSEMTIDMATDLIPLTTEETDFKGERWYEIWVEWAAGQWQKEFKGRLTLTPSGNYNANG